MVTLKIVELKIYLIKILLIFKENIQINFKDVKLILIENLGMPIIVYLEITILNMKVN